MLELSRFCIWFPILSLGPPLHTNRPLAPPAQVGNLYSQRARVNVRGKTSVTFTRSTLSTMTAAALMDNSEYGSQFTMTQQTCTQRDQIARHLLVFATYKGVRVIRFHCPPVHTPCHNGFSNHLVGTLLIAPNHFLSKGVYGYPGSESFPPNQQPHYQACFGIAPF